MGKHLDFYYNNLESGRIPRKGLCECADHGLISKKLLHLFEPTSDDRIYLMQEKLSTTWWGSLMTSNACLNNKFTSFTNMRQTIVLLMAAINNEL